MTTAAQPGGVAYDPNDPVQQAFLAALALGETGGAPNAATEGVGGTDLSGVTSVDQYGFPIWSGLGNSHAAGTYQFQPATWDSIAQQYNLNFANASDQAEGAWYLAEQTDPSLYSQLKAGDYQAVQSSLSNIWPSVTGNAAAPQGLAASISAALSGSSSGSSSSGSGGASSGASSSSGSKSGSWITTVENFFVRFGLIIIGGIIVIVALWQILSDRGVVPSPADTASSAKDAAGHLATAALAAA